MNQYAMLARDHWRRHMPSRYASLHDPEMFFTSLGEQAAEEIDTMTEALAGPDQPGETYLQKVGRLTEARATAESTVLREAILLPNETNE